MVRIARLGVVLGLLVAGAVVGCDCGPLIMPWGDSGDSGSNGDGGASSADAGYCESQLAQTTFTFGLCVCQDLAMANALYSDGYSSSSGSYQPDGEGGSVGVHQNFLSAGLIDITGSLYSGIDYRPLGADDIHGELHVGDESFAAGDIHIYHDAYVVTSITGIQYTIDGTLHIPAAGTVGLAVDAANTVLEPVAVQVPCRCDGDQLVDVAAMVADAASRNDNGAIGLTPGAWSNIVDTVDQTFPPGRYYLSGVKTVAPITVRVSGPTGLFIDGDLESASIFEVILDDNGPNPQLDLFITGNVIATGVFELGTRQRPAQVRAYVAGDHDITFLGMQHLGINLYAPNARFLAVGDLEIYGALLCKQLVDVGLVRIHYDTDILVAGNTCEAPTQQGPDHCASCIDCGNQACISGSCGRCTDSAQCCPPLVCLDGSCELVGG